MNIKDITITPLYESDGIMTFTLVDSERVWVAFESIDVVWYDEGVDAKLFVKVGI
jgi:hypothetical protein